MITYGPHIMIYGLYMIMHGPHMITYSSHVKSKYGLCVFTCGP